MFDRTGPRILIVEDDPMILELLVTRLELSGYRTSHARDGHQALRALESSLPDAVLLDVNLPKVDGFGVLRALAARPAPLRPPVLMLTARNALEDVQRCIALGARDYMAKPFCDAVLLKRVARLVRSGSPDGSRPARAQSAA